MRDVNERAVIGANNPPDEFIMIAEQVSDLRAEALLHLDGMEVTSQGQCDALDSLYKTAIAVEKLADAARIAARKEADQIIAQIQAKYNPLLADAERIKKAARAGTVAWKQKLIDDANAEAKRVADLARAAQEAAQAEYAQARADNNLEAIEASEQALANADTLSDMAKKAAKPIATGLRTVWLCEIEDYAAYLKWFRENHVNELKEFLAAQAGKDVYVGARELPGVRIWSEKK